jgi:formamidopyrimidine-DNA glycosylase
MPELPEVEMYARYFARHALRQPIAKVRVIDERILGATRRATFVRELTGRTFRDVRRHGKHLFADAGGPWLHLHFGMTGDLAYYRDKAQPRFAKVVFEFRNGAYLAFEDMRLFGFAELSSDPETYVREQGLGPDPLDPQFTLRAFRARLGTRRAAIKAVLLSQDVIAGVGNLYADETLFRAGIDPQRTIDQLTADEIKSIFGHMRRVLRETIELKARDGDYPARFLLPHRGEDEPCPKCGGAILRTVVGGRTTYYCGSHQR